MLQYAIVWVKIPIPCEFINKRSFSFSLQWNLAQFPAHFIVLILYFFIEYNFYGIVAVAQSWFYLSRPLILPYLSLPCSGTVTLNSFAALILVLGDVHREMSCELLIQFEIELNLFSCSPSSPVLSMTFSNHTAFFFHHIFVFFFFKCIF